MADAAPKTQTKSPSDHGNQSKFFLYKAGLVTLVLVLVPLFPSLAPDFFSQTFHSTSWELLQLIFVGIAVSYGLFSKKNDIEPHKDNHKVDNAQLYLSKLLQVSSVFDDESESDAVIEENKFQALNSQYQRGEPDVVVREQNDAVSQISRKPLLLPVRSLNHPLPSPNSRAGEVEKEEEEEKVVLRSPIPWRSRSGRMKMKENGDDEITSPSLDLKRSDQSRSFRANPNSSPSSPSLLYESESESKSGEGAVRKKSFVPPPPAPPPPPSPAFLRKSVLMKANSSIGSTKTGLGSGEKAVERSARSVRSHEEMMRSDEGISTSEGGEESGPDVDKKADEFIAKFREQIRQQRIETIRRSAAQRAGKNTM
ncbi:hypothetical protein SASPL_112683 [Salvia splendens]|uniref:Uncharacterized protein n=1 Tax=Salvia splendens TaxID=180675 RepID=A0A8X9A3I2_SALSN|nr:formin-like protein 2 [Salvia splendens]KAG6428432.1 hypothetical protein SASPL_112683 [Salvia splendens]